MATKLRELDIDLTTRGHLEKGLEPLNEEFAGPVAGAALAALAYQLVRGEPGEPLARRAEWIASP